MINKIVNTDPALAPSQRLLTILDNHFSRRGYKLIKSRKQFVRACDLGEERIIISFIKTGFLVSAELDWEKGFWGIERVYSQIIGKPRSYKTRRTISASISNYSKSKEELNVFKLFNGEAESKDELYPDRILNQAARRIIELSNKYVEPFFQNFSSYISIDEALNQMPINYCEVMSWSNKRITLGLILAKYLNRQDLEQLIFEYRKYIVSQNEHAQKGLKKAIEETLSFIDQNDVVKIIEKENR